MLTLDSLEPELVQIIVEYVNDSSPRTTKSIALVNKYLYSATKVVSSRHKTIVYDRIIPEDLQRTINSVSADPDAVVGIQHLTLREANKIYRSTEYIVSNEDYFDPIVQLLCKIRKLKTLTWSTEDWLPKSLLDILHTRHPTAKLKIWNFKRQNFRLDHLTEAEVALSKSPALTHLRADISSALSHLVDGEQDYQLVAIKRIMAQAPKLEYAGVICNEFAIENSLSGDNPKGLPKLVPLHTKPNKSIRALTLDGRDLKLSPETLNHWKEIVDLSQLTNLKLSRGLPTIEYFKSASQILPNLKHVSLNFGMVRASPDHELCKAGRTYLYSCPPLRTISLWAWTKVVEVEELVRQHGSELESLQLHERSEWRRDKDGRKIIGTDEIRTIREKCPRLSDFTMDLVRDDTEMDLETEADIMSELKELSLFGSRLQKLQFYVDMYSHHGIPQLQNTDSDSDDDDGDDESEESEERSEGSEQDEAEGVEEVQALATTDEALMSTSAQAAEPELPTSSAGLNETSQDNPPAVDQPTHIANGTTLILPSRQPDSPSSPPSKRAKTDDNTRTPIETYVETIWKVVFGDKTTGARALDVKFGEWETRWWHTSLNRFLFEVRPHERDDRVGQCWLKMQHKGYETPYN